jgi:hypothetical protein
MAFLQLNIDDTVLKIFSSFFNKIIFHLTIGLKQHKGSAIVAMTEVSFEKDIRLILQLYK